MRYREIHAWLARDPFEPVMLVMSSGEALRIRRREHAFLTSRMLFAGVGPFAHGVPYGATMWSLAEVAELKAIKPMQRRGSR
jgi:hypothetical protein